MKVSISSVVLLALTIGALGCAKPSNAPELADGQEDAILKSKNLNDSYMFRNSETGEIVESDKDGKLYSQKYTYLTGSPVKWSGPIKWWYNPVGQPSFVTNADAVNALIAVTQKWSAVCGVTFAYQGLTTNTATLSSCNGATVVGWGPLSGSTVGQTQACFNSTNTFTEFDMVLDNEQPLQINSVDMLQMTAIHEFGHAFGLGHTDVSPAVMTAYLTTGTPVSDDIAGCQSLYGPPPISTTTTTTTTTTTMMAPATTTTTTMAPTTTTTTMPSSTGWTRCAVEGGICSFSGTRNVRYGANGIYVTKAVPSSIACTNTAFGTDPVPGVAKACDYSNTTVLSPAPGTYKIRTHMNTAYCGDVASATNGSALHLWSCMSGNLNQSMSYTSASEIRVHGKCLHVTSTTSGAPVVVQDCNGSANQKWTYNSATRQWKGFNNMCMDLAGSSVVNGTKINANTCTTGTNQQWDQTAP